MLYWLAPRVFQVKQLFSKKLAEAHFWIGMLGILLYIIPIYVAGITQGLMWFAMGEEGTLTYEFIETTQQLGDMYWARVIGGGLYFLGALTCAVNIFMTWMMRPATYEKLVQSAPPLARDYQDAPMPVLPLRASGVHVPAVAYRLEYLAALLWHRRWERLPLLFTVMVTVAVVVASLFEIVPTFLIKSNVPTIQTVTPYTPLELVGRDIYISNGCNNCHSQMVRPIWSETRRYGEYSKAGEFVYDHPFLWGSRRIGPDVHRLGGKYPHSWHVKHMRDPEITSPGSIMPPYAWLETRLLDFDQARAAVAAMAALGVPYDRELEEGVAMARAQAEKIAAEIVEQGERPGLADKQIVALIAYLQRLGIDIQKTASTADTSDGSAGKTGG